MGAVHLRMVKLERNRQIIPEPSLFIASPNHKRIVENARVHADSAIDFGIDDGRRADDHAVFG